MNNVHALFIALFAWAGQIADLVDDWHIRIGLYLKGTQRQRFGDMGLIELRKTNNFQPQSHF